MVGTKVSDRWEFDTRARRYRDGSTGRFLANQVILDLRDELLEARVESTARLAAGLADGRLDLHAWQLGMRAVIRDTALAEYIFGRGGRNAMTAADYGRIGAVVKDQYGFLQGFAEEIARGLQSPAQVAARSAMYAHAGVAAHSIGQQATYGGRLTLPAHPGQGTECRANCRCHWSIQESPEAWVCTWVREGGDSCETCTSRAAQYSPFVQSRVTVAA